MWAFTVFIGDHCKSQQFSGKSMSLVKLLQEDKTKEILMVASYLSYKMTIERKVIFTPVDIEQLGYYGSIFLKESASFVVKAMRNAVEQPIYQFRHLILQEFLCTVYCFANDILVSKGLLPIGSYDIVAPIICGLQGAVLENSQSPCLIKYFAEQLHQKRERSVLMIEEVVKMMPNNCLEDYPFYCLILSLFEFQNAMPKGLKEMLTVKLIETPDLIVDIKHCHILDYFIHFMLILPTYTEPGSRTYLFDRNVFWSLTISNFEVKEYQLVSLQDVILELSVINFRYAKIEGIQGLAQFANSIINAAEEAESMLTL